MHQIITMSPFSLLLLVSFSLLGQGRHIAGNTKSGNPDTHLNTSADTSSDTFLNTFPDTSSDTILNTFPDTVLDTSSDTFINTFPDTYINTSMRIASENFLNRSKR